MRSRCSCVLLALCVAAACGGPSMVHVPSLGLSEPTELLVYGLIDGGPAYCATPALLLDQVERDVHANYPGSSVARRTDASGVAFLRVVTPLPAAEGATCRDFYDSEMWTERERDSTAGYRVLAFSWVRRVCNAETYVAPKADSGTRRMSDDLRALFDECRRLK